MHTDSPEVQLWAAGVCWAAAGRQLDKGLQPGSHIVQTSRRGGTMGKHTMEDRYVTPGQVLTPEVMRSDAWDASY